MRILLQDRGNASPAFAVAAGIPKGSSQKQAFMIALMPRVVNAVLGGRPSAAAASPSPGRLWLRGGKPCPNPGARTFSRRRLECQGGFYI